MPTSLKTRSLKNCKFLQSLNLCSKNLKGNSVVGDASSTTLQLRCIPELPFKIYFKCSSGFWRKSILGIWPCCEPWSCLDQLPKSNQFDCCLQWLGQWKSYKCSTTRSRESHNNLRHSVAGDFTVETVLRQTERQNTIANEFNCVSTKWCYATEAGFSPLMITVIEHSFSVRQCFLLLFMSCDLHVKNVLPFQVCEILCFLELSEKPLHVSVIFFFFKLACFHYLHFSSLFQIAD